MDIEIRTAKNMDEVKNAYYLSAQIFGTDPSESMKRKKHILEYDKVSSCKEVILALDKDKIIGMVRIAQRKIRFLSSILKTSAISLTCIAGAFS